MKFKRGLKNVFFGLINLVLTSAVAIIVPRLVIDNFGSEVNGLVSSITQIFAYFTLLEAGVGLASLQALYGPVGNNDQQSVNRILSATHQYYKRTAIHYLIAIVVFVVFYSITVKTEIDLVIVVSLILINGASGLVNLYFQGKYKILLEAEGKNYIITNLLTLTQLTLSIGRIIMLLSGFSILVVQSLLLITTFAQILFVRGYVKKNYSWLSLRAEPDYQSISQKSSVLVHQISGVIFNNTDILFLTIFTNLKVVSVYALYNMIFQIVKTGFNHISSGVIFAFGQLYHTDFNKFKRYFQVYEVYYIALVFSVGLSLTLLIRPFMSLYTKGITDIDYVDNIVILLFAAILLLLAARTPSRQIIDIAGHFSKTQNRAIFESMINITVTLMLVVPFGMYGVLLGTIFALLYRSTDMILYANRVVLERNSKKSFINWGVNILLFLLLYKLSYSYVVAIDDYISLLSHTIGFTVLSVFFFLCINSLTNISTSKLAVSEVFRILKGFKSS